MKAVVVELKNGFAAVLSDDGCVVTIKNNNYEIGQVIQMINPKIRFNKKIAAFAATAAACLMLGVGGWAYASPYTYVSLDVNPSIEFSVNRFDRVLSVKAVNDDGEEILKEISLGDLENKTIYDALTTTVSQISEAGYFDSDIEGGIVIATSSEDTEKAEDLAQDLQETVKQETVENGDDVAVEAFSVGLERVEEARELGVTPGKLNLVEKLQATAGDDAEINIEEWLGKPVKDIMKATKDYKKALTDTAAVDEDGNDVNTEDAKALEKAEKAAEKAKEKADKAAEKAKEKANKATEKAKEVAEETDEDQIEAAEEAAKIADQEAKDAQKDADKAKEESERAAEKAKKQAEAAKKAAEKTNTENDSSDDSTLSTDEDSTVSDQDNNSNSIDDEKNQYNNGKAEDSSDNEEEDNGKGSSQSSNGNSESGYGQNSGKSNNGTGKSGNND